MRDTRHVVASVRHELEGFEASGMVMRGKMRPIGELHALEPSTDKTLCGMKRETMHVFDTLNFAICQPWQMCASCRRSARL